MVTTREDLIAHITTDAPQSPTKQFKQLSALVADMVASDVGPEEFSARSTAIHAALNAHLPLPEYGWHYAWLRDQLRQQPPWWTAQHTAQVHQLRPIIFERLLHSVDSTMPQCRQFIADCAATEPDDKIHPSTYLEYFFNQFTADSATAAASFAHWADTATANHTLPRTTVLGVLTDQHYRAGELSTAHHYAQQLVLATDLCPWQVTPVSAAVVATLSSAGDHLGASEYFARAKHLAERHSDPAALATIAAIAAAAEQADVALEILNEYPVLAARHATTWSHGVTAARCLAVVGHLIRTGHGQLRLRGTSGAPESAHDLLQPLSVLVTRIGHRFDQRHGNQVSSIRLHTLAQADQFSDRPLQVFTRARPAAPPAPSPVRTWQAQQCRLVTEPATNEQRRVADVTQVALAVQSLTPTQWEELATARAAVEAAALVECVLTVSALGVFHATSTDAAHQLLSSYTEHLTTVCAAHRWPTSATVLKTLLAAQLASHHQAAVPEWTDQVEPVVQATIRRLRSATVDPLAHPGACPVVLHYWLLRAVVELVDSDVAQEVVANFLRHAAPLAQLPQERQRVAAAELLVAIAQQPHWVPPAVSPRRLIGTAQQLVSAIRCPQVHFVGLAQQLVTAAAASEDQAVRAAIGPLATVCQDGQLAGVWQHRSGGESWLVKLTHAVTGSPASAQEWLAQLPRFVSAAAAGGDLVAACALITMQAQVYAKAGLVAVPVELYTQVVTSFDPLADAGQPSEAAVQLWFSATRSLSQALTKTGDLAGAHQLLSARLDRAQNAGGVLPAAVRTALSAQSAALLTEATLTENSAAVEWVQQTVSQIEAASAPATTIRLGSLAALYEFWWRTALAAEGVLAAEQVLTHWARTAARFAAQPVADDRGVLREFSGADLGVTPLTGREFNTAYEREYGEFLQAVGRYLQSIEHAQQMLAPWADQPEGALTTAQVDTWLQHVVSLVVGLARVGKVHLAQNQWRSAQLTLAKEFSAQLVELSHRQLAERLQRVGLPPDVVTHNTPQAPVRVVADLESQFGNQVS